MPDDAFSAAVQHAKLEAMKELAYGASHEINNPLANIAARAQTLLRDEADPERRRALEAIHHQALRAHEMIADLMLFARPPKLRPEPIDLESLLADVVAELEREAAGRAIEISLSIADDLPELVADPVQLAVAVKAVGINAIEAIGREGSVGIDVTAGRLADTSAAVLIEVRDDGPGIPADILPKMFDPFFSGREAGRGLGFGLSKCWRIVTDHGGRVIAESPSFGGALVRIELPACAVESVSHQPRPS